MRSARHGQRTTAEWVTLALSVLIVGTLITVAMVQEAEREQDDGPSLSIVFDPDHAARHGESYYVPYSVRNTGSEAISSAEFWIEVLDGERLVEQAEVQLEFLPLEGTQDGVFVTVHDPTRFTLRGRLESVQIP